MKKTKNWLLCVYVIRMPWYDNLKIADCLSDFCVKEWPRIWWFPGSCCGTLLHKHVHNNVLEKSTSCKSLKWTQSIKTIELTCCFSWRVERAWVVDMTISSSETITRTNLLYIYTIAKSSNMASCVGTHRKRMLWNNLLKDLSFF